MAAAFDRSIHARLDFDSLSTPEKCDLLIDELLPGFVHKVETDYLEKASKITVDRDRDIAKRDATADQLALLEDLLNRSGENASMPAQQIASMLDSIQSSRLSVITSQGTRFSSEKTIRDLMKELQTLGYSNAIGQAEIDILTDKIAGSDAQLAELKVLRASQRAEAGYLA
ncbi:hypothetical protein [Chachezhania sediminis]|uniref:hypothetical protein n=1 Tax=Chachezhania sediminis TaxID=2599291 RepID=UPI001E2E3DAC|nr:hypothetical protein [Chachezhania sediminis]